MEQPAFAIKVVQINVYRKTIRWPVSQAKGGPRGPVAQLFLPHADERAKRQRLRRVGTEPHFGDNTVMGLKGAVTEAVAVVPTLGKVIEFCANFAEILERPAIAKEIACTLELTI